MTTRIVRGLVASVIVGMLLVGTGLSAIARPEAGVTLGSPTALPGGRIEIHGDGFDLGEAVDVFLDRADVALAAAGEDGTVVVEVAAPRSWGEGEHWVTLLGRRSGRSARAGLEVVATAPSAWTQGGADPGQTGFVIDEPLLTPQNARLLEFAWGGESFREGESLIGGAVSEDGVVFAMRDASMTGEMQTLEARDSDGTLRWSVGIAGTAHALRLTDWWGTPLAVGDGLVTVHLFGLDDPTTHVVVAFDVGTGQERWRTALPCPTCGDTAERAVKRTGYVIGWGSTTVVDGSLFVPVNFWSPFWPAGGFGQVCALQMTTGAERWCHEVDGPSSVAVSGDQVLVASETRSRLLSLDAGTGAQRWLVDLGTSEDSWNAVTSGPAIVGDLALIATYDDGIRALSLSDGSEVWRSEVTGAIRFVTDGDAVYATDATVLDPWWCEGTIDCHPDDARLWALDLRTGQERWHRSFGQDWFWRMAGAGKVLFVQSGGSVYAVGSADGRVLTSFPAASWWGDLIAADGGVFLVGDDDLQHVDTAADLPAPDPGTLAIDPLLLPDATHEVGRTSSGWDDVAPAGLAGSSSDVTGLATFGGALYVGTASSARVGQIWRTTDGVSYERVERFEDAAIVELATFRGALYATTSTGGGFGLWRSENGQRFSGVFVSKHLPSSIHATPLVFAGNLLLAVDDGKTGARLLASDDGEVFSEIASGGLGRPEVRRFARDASRPGSHGVEFADALYLGMQGGPGAGELWRVDEDLHIERVSLPTELSGATAVPQAEFDDALYALVTRPEGLVVVRSRDGTSFEQVLAMGPSEGIDGSVVEVDDALLLATRTPDQRGSSGDDVIETGLTTELQLRRSTDGSTWEPVTRDGFADPHDFAGTLLSEGGVVYLAAANYREGDGVWRSEDGLEWQLLFRGSPSVTTHGTVLTVFDEHLLAFHGDASAGLGAWRYRDPVPVGPPPGQPPWPWVAVAAGVAMLLVAGVFAWRGRHHGRPSRMPHAPAPVG